MNELPSVSAHPCHTATLDPIAVTQGQVTGLSFEQVKKAEQFYLGLRTFSTVTDIPTTGRS